MAQPALRSQVEAEISGDVSGQVGVGNHILQIGSIHGGWVTINPSGQQPQPVEREIFDHLRPRPFPNFVDRESELERMQSAVATSMPVQIVGQEGIGKTSLLRAFSERVDDNLLYFRTQRHEAADILQELFDAFYDWPGQKPTDTQIRKALRDKQALVMLDDLECDRDDLIWLLDAVPGCTFTCASTTQLLWGEGRAVRLGGVDREGGLSLLEREIGRPLSAEERSAATTIWESLKGHPFHLIRAAALVQEGQATLARLAQAAVGDGRLLARTLSQRTREEQAILVALAAAGDAPLDAAHVERLTKNPRASEILEELRSEGLVQAHSPRFTLSGDLSGYIRDRADLDSWSAGFLRYFINWAEQHGGDPQTLLPDLDAMLATLDWAVENERWAEVVRLGRAIDSALTLSRRWGAWERVLRRVRRAAVAAGDQAAEAWALHQLGVRALSLGAYDSARPHLQEAVGLRSRLGDSVGRDLSQYHLDLLGSPPPPPSEWPPQSGSSGFPPLPLLGAAVIALVLIAYLLFGMGSGESDPTPTSPGFAGVTPDTPTVAPVVSSTDTPTRPPTDTPSPTFTPTNTPSLTPTDTPSPTPTPSDTPSPTPTPTDTPTPTPTPTICPGPPDSWVIYTVQPGDTLFSLATETNTTVQEVRQANCMAPGETRIVAGQDLWLPRLPQPPQPDLIVSNVAQTDSAYFRNDQRIGVPVAVTIRNQGDAPADVFKVSMDAITESGRFLFPFSVPGQDGPWYPFTAGALAAGDSVTFSGEVSFDDRYQGQTVRLLALADSCAGDEFFPSYCRVEEGDENNNESSALAIDLPTEPEPPSPPDLIVGDIAQTDSPYWDQGEIAVPVVVTIRNQGGEPAGVFKVSMDAITESGRFLFPFTAPGQDSPWYPFTDGSLAGGDSVDIVGEVLFDSNYQGETVRLIALADSCAGEEFVPPYCRVDESNENNNESFELPVNLPFRTIE